MTVGLVIVSHSAQLAEGVVELAGQMAQGDVAIAAAGGTSEGVLGTSVEKILAALHEVDGPDGILVLLDLGSAVMATEGAGIAAVESSIGNSLQEVAEAASGACTLPKVHSQNR